MVQQIKMILSRLFLMEELHGSNCKHRQSFTIVAIQPGTQGIGEDICDTEFGTRDIEKCGRLFHKRCVDKFSVNSITLVNQNECGQRTNRSLLKPDKWSK